MSILAPGTSVLLETIASIQTDIGDGKPARPTYGEGLSDPERTPFDIHTVCSREEANAAVPGLADPERTIGEGATVSDEGSICATWERAIQGSNKSRVRHMAHAHGRAHGQGLPVGNFLYGMQELLTRPEGQKE